MTISLKLLRIKEVAELLGANPAKLRKWNKEGKLPAIKISKRGNRRYKHEDIEKFLKKISK